MFLLTTIFFRKTLKRKSKLKKLPFIQGNVIIREMPYNFINMRMYFSLILKKLQINTVLLVFVKKIRHYKHTNTKKIINISFSIKFIKNYNLFVKFD